MIQFTFSSEASAMHAGIRNWKKINFRNVGKNNKYKGSFLEHLMAPAAKFIQSCFHTSYIHWGKDKEAKNEKHYYLPRQSLCLTVKKLLFRCFFNPFWNTLLDSLYLVIASHFPKLWGQLCIYNNFELAIKVKLQDCFHQLLLTLACYDTVYIFFGSISYACRYQKLKKN